jgi:uncharacterized protein YjbI with pentapeptide repeats
MFALGTAGVWELNLGEVLPAQLEPSILLADLTMECSTRPAGKCPEGLPGGGPYLYVGPFTDAIFRWDNGLPIPGTEGLNPGPGLALNNSDLRYALLSKYDLTGSSFVSSNLSHAKFVDANLSAADLTEANLTGAFLGNSTLTNANLTAANLTRASLESSTLTNANLTAANLTGADLTRSTLANTDLTAADLSGANLASATLTNANLGGAVVTGTGFWDTTSQGFTEAQLASTANYQSKDLRGVRLGSNDLTGWDFRGQDLTGAVLSFATLTNADLTDAIVTRTAFDRDFDGKGTGITYAQLASTASYQTKNLQGIGLAYNVLTGWDFSGQNLSGASLDSSRLTNANLTTANLAGAFLFYADLTSATLIGANLNDTNLAHSRLTNADLTAANLSGANLAAAVLRNANLTGAEVRGATFGRDPDGNGTGLTHAQLASTASYQSKDLQRIGLVAKDLTGWNLSGQNLTGAVFYLSRLTNADLSGAVVTGADFGRDWAGNGTGITHAQLASTASYQMKDLRRIDLVYNDLSDWDFSGQNLTGADLSHSTLTNANLAGAKIKYASLAETAGLSSATFDAATVYNQWTVFPAEFDPATAGLTLVMSPYGDLDGDDSLMVADVDELVARIRGFDSAWWVPNDMFDLNRDGMVNLDDQRVWVHDLKSTWYGDANLDREFNSGDLVQVLAADKYETTKYDFSLNIIPTSWSEGDWTGDGLFNSTDLVVALADGGYEAGPRQATATVPEPCGDLLLALSLLALIGCRRG